MSSMNRGNINFLFQGRKHGRLVVVSRMKRRHIHGITWQCVVYILNPHKMLSPGNGALGGEAVRMVVWLSKGDSYKIEGDVWPGALRHGQWLYKTRDGLPEILILGANWTSSHKLHHFLPDVQQLKLLGYDEDRPPDSGWQEMEGGMGPIDNLEKDFSRK